MKMQIHLGKWNRLVGDSCYPFISFIFYEYTKYFDINDIVFQSWQIRMKYSQRKSQMTITITQIIDQEEIVTVTLYFQITNITKLLSNIRNTHFTILTLCYMYHTKLQTSLIPIFANATATYDFYTIYFCLYCWYLEW